MQLPDLRSLSFKMSEWNDGGRNKNVHNMTENLRGHYSQLTKSQQAGKNIQSNIT